MNKEIVVDIETGKLSLGDIKKKSTVRSICDLRQTFFELISAVQVFINRNGTYAPAIDIDQSYYDIQPLPFRVNIQPEDMELLVDQLIFDILFDKYLADRPSMTLQQYSLSHSDYRWDGRTDSKLIIDSVRKCVSAAAQRHVDIMSSPELRSQIKKLGVNPDKYFEHLIQVSTPFANSVKQEIVTKPKIVWDYIYYNGTQKLITGKQYARSFLKHNNYSYNAIEDIFNTYDRFIAEVFLQEPKSSKDFFMKSLEFYSLEIYKRIDFMYKLAVRLGEGEAPAIDKKHPLVCRFHPEVLGFLEQNSRPEFRPRNKYYRPMLMLEDLWQSKELYKNPQYLDMLQKHHLVRAKVYELFKYHAEFVSIDYDEIANFVKEHYNILDYHEPQKNWIREDKGRKSERVARIKKALEINEALFGER